jgi:hypothetical protein
MRMAMTVHVPGSVHCHCRSVHQHVSPITKSVRWVRWVSHHGEKIGCQWESASYLTRTGPESWLASKGCS